MKQLFLSLFLLINGILLAQSTRVTPSFPEKIDGLNLVAMNRLLDSSEITPLQEISAGWTAVIPYAFVRDLHQPELIYNSEHQWIGERLDGVEHTIRLLRIRGVHVMLKPQIWAGHGEFTGDIEMYTEEDWQLFEAQYRDYILTFADLARREGVAMFCIGTEMATFVKLRPRFWEQLIKAVRDAYPGKLTYAENWDAYAKVPFWKQLDFIGIDAYFPIAKGKNPKISVLKSGWETISKDLAKLSDETGRKILFTEYGYRSTARCAEEPWEFNGKDKLSEKAQHNALQALYETLWSKPFFQGGFLWKWHPNNVSGEHDHDKYSVQHKIAEDLVRTYYEKQ